MPGTLEIPSNEDKKIESGFEKEAIDLTKLTTPLSTQSVHDTSVLSTSVASKDTKKTGLTSKNVPSHDDVTLSSWKSSHFLTGSSNLIDTSIISYAHKQKYFNFDF
eukprot:5567757-Ditylum_brightwellii.AAC.1